MKFLVFGYLVLALNAPMLVWAQQQTAETVASRTDQLMRGYAAAGDFSGSVLVAHDGHILKSAVCEDFPLQRGLGCIPIVCRAILR